MNKTQKSDVSFVNIRYIDGMGGIRDSDNVLAEEAQRHMLIS